MQKIFNWNLWKVLDWFKLFPLAAVIDNKYFCVHGGISPDYVGISDCLEENSLNFWFAYLFGSIEHFYIFRWFSWIIFSKSFNSIIN